MRKRIYEIIEKAEKGDRVSAVYDFAMIIFIVLSLIPLAFKNTTPFWFATDKVCVVVFIIDYILRWLTADYKYEKRTVSSFVKYPFSMMAIIDLLSILPSLTLVNSGFKVLRLLRMLRAMRVLRIFKTVRYSNNFRVLNNVMRASKNSLMAVCILAVGYILASALVIFNVEPYSFNNFFEAVYWATVSLTTVGYGDIYPISTVGRIITMISSVFGIAIVALPAGIITAGYVKEIERQDILDQETENR